MSNSRQDVMKEFSFKPANYKCKQPLGADCRGPKYNTRNWLLIFRGEVTSLGENGNRIRLQYMPRGGNQTSALVAWEHRWEVQHCTIEVILWGPSSHQTLSFLVFKIEKALSGGIITDWCRETILHPRSLENVHPRWNCLPWQWTSKSCAWSVCLSVS